MVAKMNRVHFPKVGEGVLHIGSGTPYEVSEEPQYEVGTYVRFGRKGFVYARAGASYPCLCHLGAKTSHRQKIESVAIQANALIHATEIKLTSDVSCSEDELKGGEVLVKVAGDKPFTRGIIGNDAMTATATLTLQLDSPIPVAIETTDTAQVIRNPYANVGIHSAERNMVMGIPVMTIPTLWYGWLQVEGIAWCSLDTDTVGVDVNQQNIVFCGDGSLRLASVEGYEDGQLAGTIITTNLTDDAAAPFIMLQVAH